MKSLIIRILPGLLILILLSCEKEEVDKLLPDHLVIDTSSTDYSFKEVVNKVVYASLFGSSSTDYSIDLNNDGTEDIQFACSVYHHTVYDEWNAIVKTLNDDVALDVEADTIFIANYSIEIINPSGNDTILMMYSENYDHSKQYPSNLTIDSQRYDFPVVHSIGDSLNQLCNWKSGTFVFESDDHHKGQIQNNIQIGNWRSIDDRFIGFRFVEKNTSYYGWLELGVQNYTITLYKYALKMK